MAAAKSTSIVLVRIGGFSFKVKLRNMVQELKTSRRDVCAKHEVPVTHLHVCQDCHHPITESVLGAPGAAPRKRRTCTNGQCGARTDANVESLAFCPECRQVLKEGESAKATVFGDDMFVMSKDQRDGITKLRLPERSIVVRRALARSQVPSMRYVRSVQEILPCDKAYDQLAFQLTRTAARKQDLSFACHTAIKMSEDSVAFEHGALLQFDPDGTVLLVLLHAEHEVLSRPVDAAEPPIELQQHAARLQSSLVDQIAPLQWAPLLSTPAVRAFHGLLRADDRKRYVVPTPEQAKDEVNALALKLLEGMEQHLGINRQPGEAETQPDEKAEEGDAPAAVAADTSVTSDTNG